MISERPETQAPTDEEDDRTVIRNLDDSVSSTSSGSNGPGEATSPRVLKQRFVLDRKLGSGGMGTVFRAKDLRKVEARDRDPYLAIKVLNNDFRDRPEAFIALQREASKSQAMSHRNIVSIFDFDKDGELPFMTMELLKGAELSEVLKGYPNGLPADEVWPLVRSLCDGLQHAHEQGVVHADFKPGNVFVCDDGVAKIFDFGIARAVQKGLGGGYEDADDTAFDVHGMGALTPAYASAEMLRGSPPEASDDIFALGIVIYLMLTGRHPYDRVPADEARTREMMPARPKQLRAHQWRALQSALALNREQRPTSADALARGLLDPPFWQTRTAMAVAATVVVAVIAGAVLQSSDRAQVKQEVEEDVRLDRVYSLMATPSFDEAWQQQIESELSSLAERSGAGSDHADLVSRLRELYVARIADTDDLEAAYALYERALRYGAMPTARALLAQRHAQMVDAWLAESTGQASWLVELDRRTQLLAQRFPESPRNAELAAEIEIHLITEAQSLAGAGDVSEAEALRQRLGSDVYDLALADQLDEALALAETSQRDEQSRLERGQRRLAADRILAGALEPLCARRDIDAVAAALASIRARYAERYKSSLASADKSLLACVASLAPRDADAAAALRSQALNQIDGLAGLAAFRLDPCSLDYLVDAGATAGRGGFCVDKSVADGSSTGVRLVVVSNPADGERFAISKAETSWGAFRTYCQNRKVTCPSEPADALPVTSIALTEAQAYARWLSAQTGYTYRLPTLAEWQLAAAGVPDPNRNCRHSTAGIERGLALAPAASGAPNAAGLLNSIGNVREWVLDGDQIRVAGASFREALASCDVGYVKPHSGEADSDTGFRLVRELK